MRRFNVLFAVALLGFAGCPAESAGIADPTVIEQDLVGTWLQSGTATQGSGTGFTLSVTDSVVQGNGHWFAKASPGGTLVVNGFVSGPTIDLEIAEDNGTKLHFQARMLDAGFITGSFIGNGTRVAASYERQ